MKRLSSRLEILVTPEQKEEWTALAKERNLTKSELIRRIMSNSNLKKQRIERDWNIYQRLGELSDELKQKREECFVNPVKTINEIIKSIEALRLEVIKK